jgi:histidinol-phosphate phosphatase family protein
LLVNFSFREFLNFLNKKKSDLCIVGHPNDHPYDSDLLVSDKNDRLLKIYSKPHRKNLIYKNLTAAGIFFLKGKLIKLIPDKKLKFNTFVIPYFLKKKITAHIYNTSEFIKDVGTVDRIKNANKIENSQKFLISNYLKKRPAIFLDRDGVINKEINFKVEDPSILLPNTLKAIKKINLSKYLIIIITNQPAVAKGFITEKKLNFLHMKLETKLGNFGAYIDDIFYCPHHPLKGFKGENKSLKIKCKCRKPNIGLIEKAKKKHNIDLKKSFFVGNSDFDKLCAKKAGIKYFEINNKFQNLFEILRSNQKLIRITI